MSINIKADSRIKKYLPFILLVILTFSLMFYFKENKGSFGELVDKGTSDLLTLYTENLQPLLFGTDLNNEDVFNFALYQTVPIDKEENRMLRINERENGDTYYQVLPEMYKADTKNYEKFTKYMAFSNEEKTKLDSLLESYKPELAEAILTDSKNTVAVSSRLANLQKAILTDIAAFSNNADKPRMSELFGKEYSLLDSKRALNLVNEIKRDTSKEYLVIAEDTAFTSRIEFDNEAFEAKMREVSEKLSKLDGREFKVRAMPSKAPPLPPVKKYSWNDTSITYSFASPSLGKWEFSDGTFDSLEISLSKLEEGLKKMSFRFDSLNKNLKFDFSSDSLDNFSFELNLQGLGEIINKSIEGAAAHPNDEEYWENFGAEVESLASRMVVPNEDSLKNLKKKLNEMKRKKRGN